MRQILLTILFIGCFSTTSLCQTDNDLRNSLLSTPFMELFYAINTYNVTHDERPPSFEALHKLTIDDWHESCYTYYSGKDTTIVPRLDYYRPNKTSLKKTPDGLRVDFELNESEFTQNVEEYLYSALFDADFYSNYEVLVTIKKGNGFIEFPDSNNYLAKVTLFDLQAKIGPPQYKSGPTKKVKIDTTQEFFIEKEDFVCVERIKN